jgi:beta-hydroxylase
MTITLSFVLKFVFVALLVASGFYVHLRGRVRHGVLRQISDHSNFLAPMNAFMLLFSRVPRTAYLSPDLFPDLKPLTAQWQMIRDEAVAMQSAGAIKASAQLDDVGFNSFFKTGWKRFYLKWYDEAHPSAATLCPKTTALLRSIPSVKAAMFAELPPNGRLVRHRDPYAGSLRYHLGLVTPSDPRCYIDVDGQQYYWKDGEAVVFDETYIHYAENKTDCNRIILFCDIERPMRFRWTAAVNHWLGRNLVAAAAAPNVSGDKTGGLNRVFVHVMKVRVFFKRLKSWNRRVYYGGKWVLFLAMGAGIVYWLVP